ncbi:hypothetical protein LAZ67_X004601 [Cordylochernes scorpioides]|uniref:Uncharacterized protein n=1 Tax=Cordylochernes scorpioides TaxID=51811 RepID=A0ABY6LV46_9ARAC|nr:hypothetical protein LAZ67_X004601 [Cordylochernes scorpioides]
MDAGRASQSFLTNPSSAPCTMKAISKSPRCWMMSKGQREDWMRDLAIYFIAMVILWAAMKVEFTGIHLIAKWAESHRPFYQSQRERRLRERSKGGSRRRIN